MLLNTVVETSTAVGATRSRKAKTEALAAVLRACAVEEIAPVTAWLSGEPLQGRLGVGFRTLSGSRTAPAAEPSLTVLAVDALLSALAGTSGAGSTARRSALLAELWGAAVDAEQRFLVQLIGGELRQGALEGVMVEAIALAADVPAPVVRRAFMLSGSLPSTAALALTDGVAGLATVRLEVGRPVRPMLASPGASLDAALESLGADVTVEYKLDGARIQVHRDGESVRVWTRTLREITAAVPELVEHVRALPCTSAVLDGETLALTDDGRPRKFQDTMSRFGSDGSEEVLLSPFFFDLLHLDGQDLLDAPLAQRLDALAGLLPPELAMPGVRRPSAEEAADVLDGALTAGHEGVVVKALDAPYAAGRRGKSWQKVKPVHTLDLVVIGAEWGYGRRTGLLSNIHLAARDPDGGPPVMVGKTFKGMTDELLAWQTKEFPGLAVHDDGHVVELRPQLVVEIALDGAQRSVRYPGGVALRFARVLRYRPDKTPAEADTLDSVQALL
ncbi:ATP-dependent DNA ligase [Pseudonocardia sp. WMMC193]|uniref:ATP-dependent DNA ligase n=1 Tax=Pseudonocardia sp. WMMC193 TaxID=2911965 RepID=UPI001F032B1C|nr:ATP-dependent DNA ligase [Pseudonocardia sp. WMMC193]MCF7551209.1 ATP-dependent DNA ligase [Pseudonocardia sp. WMMC193]